MPLKGEAYKNSFTPDRQQLKMIILSRNIVKKIVRNSLIAICQPSGDKWHLKTLFLAIFDLRSSIVMSVFHSRLSGVSFVNE